MEPCSKAQAKQSRQEEQQGEMAEEDVEVSYGDNEPEESRGGEWPLSPDHSGMEDMKSGVLEQVQKEEAQTLHERKFSHMTVNQESQDRGSGVCGERWDIRCYSLFQHNKIQSCTFQV